MKVRLLPEAREELRASARWYEEKRRGLGADLMAVIDEALARVAEQPEACPSWGTDRTYRTQLVRRFPYTIFFRMRDGEVEVVAFAHQKRKPGYWLGR